MGDLFLVYLGETTVEGAEIGDRHFGGGGS